MSNTDNSNTDRPALRPAYFVGHGQDASYGPDSEGPHAALHAVLHILKTPVPE